MSYTEGELQAEMGDDKNELKGKAKEGTKGREVCRKNVGDTAAGRAQLGR